MTIGWKKLKKNEQMKIIVTIVFLFTNLLFAQEANNNLQIISNSDKIFEASQTIDIERFEKYYVPIPVTALNYYNSDSIKVTSEKPPLSALRIGGEIFVGNIAGLVLPYLLLRSINFNSDSRLIGLPVAYAIGGYIVGFPFGVYLTGHIGNQKGSYLAALGGSFLGAVVGSGVNSMLKNSVQGRVLLIAIQQLFSITAFNLSRNYD